MEKDENRFGVLYSPWLDDPFSGYWLIGFATSTSTPADFPFAPSHHLSLGLDVEELMNK
jgi:hypothetical protein